jgi:hypothetical protein
MGEIKILISLILCSCNDSLVRSILKGRDPYIETIIHWSESFDGHRRLNIYSWFEIIAEVPDNKIWSLDHKMFHAGRVTLYIVIMGVTPLFLLWH